MFQCCCDFIRNCSLAKLNVSDACVGKKFVVYSSFSLIYLFSSHISDVNQVDSSVDFLTLKKLLFVLFQMHGSR